MHTTRISASVTSLIAIDFSKAFNRLSHQLCLEALAAAGASNQSLELVCAFLENRRMLVQSGSCESSVRSTPGGSPQGTKLGNVLFCFAMEYVIEGSQCLQPSVVPPPTPHLREKTTADPPDHIELAVPPEYRTSTQLYGDNL